jgi:hypothetical protein
MDDYALDTEYTGLAVTGLPRKLYCRTAGLQLRRGYLSDIL